MTDLRTNMVGQTDRADIGHREDAQPRASGSYKGAEVKVVDMNSLLMDAAEELTSELSEETEKDVSEREVEAGRKSDSLERIFKLAELEKLTKSLGDLDKKDLYRGLKALLKQQSGDPGVLRRKAKEEFREPSHQYAVLKALVTALKEQKASPEQIAAAEQALDSLMEEEGPSIRAAINIGDTARAFAGDAEGGIGGLRDLYRSNIQDYSSMTSVLDDLAKRFGEDKLETGLAFMKKALSADLESGGPSIDSNRLTVLMNDMHRLSSLTTIYGNCRILVRQAQQRGGGAGYTPFMLLKGLVPLQDASWVSGQEIASIADRLRFGEIEAQINFLTDLLEVVRLIPLKSYSKPESRGKLLDAVQQALDGAVKTEEDEEEDDDDEDDE
ncbi:MAG: type III secretion system gatekeeper subunit SctW [Pseudomonadota bacterium]